MGLQWDYCVQPKPEAVSEKSPSIDLLMQTPLCMDLRWTSQLDHYVRFWTLVSFSEKTAFF